MSQQSNNNHYLPEMYLKNWTSNGNNVWMYRRLVSHKDVPWWEAVSIDKTAYTYRLYHYTQDDKASTDR